MAAKKKPATVSRLPDPKFGWEYRRGPTPFLSNAIYKGRALEVAIHGHIDDKTSFYLTCNALNISRHLLEAETLEEAQTAGLLYCSERLTQYLEELKTALRKKAGE